VPNECHRIGARSGNDSRRLESSSKACEYGIGEDVKISIPVHVYPCMRDQVLERGFYLFRFEIVALLPVS
jgi:hypothetical protein